MKVIVLTGLVSVEKFELTRELAQHFTLMKNPLQSLIILRGYLLAILMRLFLSGVSRVM